MIRMGCGVNLDFVSIASTAASLLLVSDGNGPRIWVWVSFFGQRYWRLTNSSAYILA